MRFEQFVHPRGQVGDLLAADAVDFGGAEAGRRMLRERRGIIGLAVGQARDAGGGPRAGKQRGQRVDLAGECGADRACEDCGGALAIARKADFRAALRDRRDERLSRDVAVAQAAKLLQRLVDDEVRRDDAHRGVRLDDFGVGVEQRRDRLQPHHIGVGVGLCRDGVLAVEEGADPGVEAAELGDAIGAGPMPEAAGMIGEARQPLARHKVEFGALVRDSCRVAERVGVDRADCGEVAVDLARPRRAGGGRPVGKLGPKCGAGAGIDPERSCARRLVAQSLFELC